IRSRFQSFPGEEKGLKCGVLMRGQKCLIEYGEIDTKTRRRFELGATFGGVTDQTSLCTTARQYQRQPSENTSPSRSLAT
ncbi:hypothetical protein HAX54_035993, partial [Datura stramonium]|nr:hypothetical protein [Datura stramonium]